MQYWIAICTLWMIILLISIDFREHTYNKCRRIILTDIHVKFGLFPPLTTHVRRTSEPFWMLWVWSVNMICNWFTKERNKTEVVDSLFKSVWTKDNRNGINIFSPIYSIWHYSTRWCDEYVILRLHLILFHSCGDFTI